MRAPWIRHGAAVALLVSVVLATGCAVGPTYTAPALAQASPSQWNSALPHDGRIKDLVRWWEQYNDPLLVDLVDTAQKTSPSVEQALARVRQARAALGVADAARAPGASAQAAGRRADAGAGAAGAVSAGLEASWELDLFGGRLRATEAAGARAEAATLRWHQARVSLAAEVAGAYLTFRHCEQALKLSLADSRSRDVTLGLVQAKVKAGAGAVAEEHRARASAAEGQGAWRAQLGACERARLQLATLTALSVDALHEKLFTATGLPPVAANSESTAIEVPAQALAQRPDVAAAERNVAAAVADIGVATADLLPSLSLLGSVGINTRGGDASIRSWSFGPSLTLPILDGGRRRSALEAAHGRHDEAMGAWRQAVLEAVAEVEDALSRLATTQSRAGHAQTAREEHEAFFDISTSRFSSGAASLLDLEDARRQTLAARQTELSLTLEHAQARVALYRAVGGGWTPSATVPLTSIEEQK
jgi:NodT family efflux transporter outer membrane factor (OMF) lipoprotein